MVLALLAPPLAAQAKETSGTAASAVVAPVDESKTPLAGSGTATPTSGGGAAPAVAQATAGVTTWDFLRMILILAVVVVVIYLVFWLVRKGSGRKVPENDLIKVLGSRGLAGNRAMHLVEVGSSIFLVGSSDGGVGLIAEITDKESIDTLRLQSAESGAGGKRTFQQILAEIFRPGRRTLSVGEGIGLLKGQRDRLKKL
jgi:flagellar biogenesis protein FliO